MAEKRSCMPEVFLFVYKSSTHPVIQLKQVLSELGNVKKLTGVKNDGSIPCSALGVQSVDWCIGFKRKREKGNLSV